jgi:hypothetical protein
MRKQFHRLLFVAPLALSVGCMAYSNVKRDTERQPTRNMGAGATVLLPGQGAPVMSPESYMNDPLGRPPAPAPGYPGQQPGSGGGNITFIGGADVDARSHRELRQDPLLAKALLAPFAIVFYPFKKAYEALQGDPEPVVEPAAQAAAAPTVSDYDRAFEESQLRELERQLGTPNQSPAPPQGSAYAPPAPTPGAARAPVPATRPSNIADELARLRHGIAPRGDLASTRPGDTAPPPQQKAVADRVGDRDRDGRPDHWQYHDGEILVRELFDEDADGRVDRTVRYDPSTGARSRVEEDADRDGQVDSWVEYRDGEVHRRRADTDGDGEPDAWTFYRGGEMARHEEDRDGDGFRDRIGYYDGGLLVRETEDRTGDGRPDQITWYDAEEQPKRRDEDRDGDGVVDVRSFYEGGRLARRELVDETAADAAVEEDELRSAGWFSDGDEQATERP